ncbi:hypothetical protein MLD38_035336 [Melastoma candidum]|uniref:Uncharacterized protein n=1 Tax=Melastoma candidum TaxID=119954 RepID=A0ACB9LGV4_9MYRT|nr:hypothetical protein MLD38_035336 [Melastoma candidum]
MRKRADLLRASAQEEPDTTLRRGARLGKQLSDEIGVIDRVDIWEILAGFWPETMLYVAPSKDIRAHSEQLANGEEFVIHLWALLHCIGIKKKKGPSTQGLPEHPNGCWPRLAVPISSYGVGPSSPDHKINSEFTSSFIVHRFT